MAPPTYTAFINYRVDDAKFEAYQLHARLSERLGDSRVFMAPVTIPGGDDYRERILDALDHSAAVVALIGSTWLSCVGENGIRRLDEPDDWVRIEIERALAAGIPIVPAEVRKGTLPQAVQLPRSIAELAYKQAFRLSEDAFDSDVARLADRLRELTSPGAGRGVIPPGWTPLTAGHECKVGFALPPSFKRVGSGDRWRHRGDNRALRMQPRGVVVEVFKDSLDSLIARAESQPLFAEREDAQLRNGSAVRVRLRKPWFKANPGGGGQLGAWVVDQFYVPVQCDNGLAVAVVTCGTVPRRIAEDASLFRSIAETVHPA